jgi:hypothetical protein
MSPDTNGDRPATARSPALLARAHESLCVERANGYESLVPGKIDLLRSFDVPAMNDVVAICYWGRSGSRLLTSFLDGHDHAALLPMEKSQRVYEFLAVHPDLSLRDKLLGYPVYTDSYTPLFHGEFPIAAAQYYAAVDALLAVYGKQPPEFLSASRTFFQFLHVAYELALGRRPATPRPLIVYAQHRLNYHTARLVKDFPKARFLHTVRDPISNFDSMFAFYLKNAIEKRQSAHSSYPEAAMRTLVELTSTDCANRGMEARTRAVRFEDLHLHTDEAMRDVAAWLGLPYRPSLLESSFNGTKWVVVGRGGAVWSGARAAQARRQSPNMWFTDRWLVYALFHEDFAAWTYPYPVRFGRPRLRRLAAIALWVLPTKIECLNAAEALKRKVIPALRSGQIGPAWRTLTGLVAHHAELMQRVRAELRRRLSGGLVALQALETGARGAQSGAGRGSAPQQAGGAAQASQEPHRLPGQDALGAVRAPAEEP